MVQQFGWLEEEREKFWLAHPALSKKRDTVEALAKPSSDSDTTGASILEWSDSSQRSLASLITALEKASASLEEKQKRAALSLAADFALRHADSHWGQLQHGEHEESIRAYERNVSVGKKLKHADGLFHGLSNMFLTHQSHGF